MKNEVAKNKLGWDGYLLIAGFAFVIYMMTGTPFNAASKGAVEDCLKNPQMYSCDRVLKKAGYNADGTVATVEVNK